MLLTRLLNACHHFPGFVYQHARLDADTKTIEIEVRPRQGAKARCSGCRRSAPGYDRLAVRRFEFIPIWGFAVMLVYAMRRVKCRHCEVKVEEVPWAQGKHTLCNAYMLFLAQWARKLSWKETALSFQTSWEKVFHAVEYVVQWGLQHRSIDAIRAIGVDEIQYGRGHRYLTLVYQIEAGCQRLLWVTEMNAAVPWAEMVAVVEPYYPKATSAGGRPPVGLERMLRIHCLQLWFDLSDPAVEEALYDSRAMRAFVRIDLGRDAGLSHPYPIRKVIRANRNLSSKQNEALHYELRCDGA